MQENNYEEALKAIPVKVTRNFLKEDTKIGNITFKKGTKILSKCPNCGYMLHPLHNIKYCGNCGQKLDWSN